MYSTEGKVKEPNMAADIGQGLLGIASSYAKKDMGGLIKGGLGILRAASGGAQKAGEYTRKTRTSPADVVCKHTKRGHTTGLTRYRRSLGAVARILKPVQTQSRLEKPRAP